jgi:hypothetical protein
VLGLSRLVDEEPPFPSGNRVLVVLLPRDPEAEATGLARTREVAPTKLAATSPAAAAAALGVALKPDNRVAR